MNYSEHCTASLMYSIADKALEWTNQKWAEIWTILGIYGDVASTKPKASEILRSLAPVHPGLVSLESDDWSGRPASIVSRVFNYARRQLYHNGAMIAFNACKEIEKFDDLYLLIHEPSDEQMPSCPNVYILRRLIDRWTEQMARVYKQIRKFELDHCRVWVVNTSIDCASSITAKERNDSKKPIFVINLGTPGHVKISGRSDGNPDIGQIFNRCDAISNGFITGGGHPAAGAAASLTGNVQKIMSTLESACSDVLRGPKEDSREE